MLLIEQFLMEDKKEEPQLVDERTSIDDINEVFIEEGEDAPPPPPPSPATGGSTPAPVTPTIPSLPTPPSTGGSGQQQSQEDITFGEKISNILNKKLYQRYLTLLNRIENQLLTIKNNLDIFTLLISDNDSNVNVLKKLNENIRTYINEYFANEDYSKNQLFFDKCINLYKLTNEELTKVMRKNI